MTKYYSYCCLFSLASERGIASKFKSKHTSWYLCSSSDLQEEAVSKTAYSGKGWGNLAPKTASKLPTAKHGCLFICSLTTGPGRLSNPC